MKFFVLATLASLAHPQQNIGGDGAGKPVWVEIGSENLRYAANRTEWPTCVTNADCSAGHVCADHMWEYGGQNEVGRGCWEFAVCSDDAAYWMFDGRKIQWWCDSYSSQAANGLDAPYGLTRADQPHFDELISGCKVNTDCPSADHFCTWFVWEGTQDGKSWGQGSACYIQDEGRCPSDAHWGTVNSNYWGDSGTGFSAYTQQDCAPVVEGAYSVSLGLALAFMMFFTSM